MKTTTTVTDATGIDSVVVDRLLDEVADRLSAADGWHGNHHANGRVYVTRIRGRKREDIGYIESDTTGTLDLSDLKRWAQADVAAILAGI